MLRSKAYNINNFTDFWPNKASFGVLRIFPSQKVSAIFPDGQNKLFFFYKNVDFRAQPQSFLKKNPKLILENILILQLLMSFNFKLS